MRGRLCYLTSARIPSRAANAVQTVKMCEAFSQNDYEVHLFARAGDYDAGDICGLYRAEPTFQFHGIEERGPRGLHTALFLSEVHRGVSDLPAPDLFFARDIYSLALMARSAAPLIYEAHRTIQPGSLEGRIFSFVTRRPTFCKLVTVTRPMMERFTFQFPWLRTDQTLVLPNATDDMAGGAPDPERDGLSGRSKALQVGYVGHLYEGRGVDVLVAAAKALPTMDFHFVGGTTADIARWEQTGLPDNAFLHGHVPHADVKSFYSRFDVLAAPYGERVYTAGGAETSAVMSPLKLYEYLSAGKPIVSSDLPAVRAILTNGEDSLLVPAGDLEALKSALQRLDRDDDLRARLGTAARKRFLERGTWRNRAARLLDELQCLVDNRAG